MRIIAVCTCVLILALASCASTQSGGAAGAAGGGGAAGSPAAGQTPQQRNSFKAKEQVYFAAGSAGKYTAGTLNEYTVFEWDSAFANIVKETRYSASDAVLEIIEYAYQGNAPASKVIKIIVPDEKGKAQEQVRTKVEYQYDQGRLQTETLKNKDENVVTLYEYAYDGQGNLISRTMKNGKGAVMAETAYTWAGGRRVSAEIKNAGGTKISSTEYQYNRQGSLIKEESRNAGGKVPSVLTITWQNGLEMKSELAGADNAPQQRETYEYNAVGDLTKKTIENLHENSAQIIQYDYTGR